MILEIQSPPLRLLPPECRDGIEALCCADSEEEENEGPALLEALQNR